MDVSDTKIPFGLKNGILVSVSEVDSGLACGCVCPSCHKKLQAKKGKKVAHYFSHDPAEDTKECKSAFETAIHLMAKQILSEERCALFPSLHIKVTQSDVNGNLHEEGGVVEEKSLRKFDSVELEKCLGDIRPDIIVYQNSIPLLIEIAVTNFSSKEKIKIIRDKSIPAIEIDLSKVKYTTTKEELKRLIAEKIDNKKWISNPAAVPIKQQLRARLNEKIININESIAMSPKKTISVPVNIFPLHQRKRVESSNTFSHITDKQYDPRWFLCEACRYVFKVPLKNAPYTIETIPCPECDHAVSTKTYMFK